MTTFAVTSVNSLRCHSSTCFRIGSKFRCIRSTPTEMQSISGSDIVCREDRREHTWENVSKEVWNWEHTQTLDCSRVGDHVRKPRVSALSE
jgi:5-methylcytosine-specific restriction endonuclease McrA